MAGDRKLCYQLASHQTYSLPFSLQCHSNCCQYVSTIVNCKGSHCLSATFLKVQFCSVKSENSAGMGDEQFRLVVTHMETACTFFAYREVNILSIPALLTQQPSYDMTFNKRNIYRYGQLCDCWYDHKRHLRWMQHRGGMDGIGHSEGKSLDEGEKREWDWMGWYPGAGWGEV